MKYKAKFSIVTPIKVIGPTEGIISTEQITLLKMATYYVSSMTYCSITLENDYEFETSYIEDNPFTIDERKFEDWLKYQKIPRNKEYESFIKTLL